MKMSPGLSVFFMYYLHLSPLHISPNPLKVKGCIVFVEILKVKIRDRLFLDYCEAKSVPKKSERRHAGYSVGVW